MSQGANVNLDADYLSQEPAIDDASPVNDNHHVNTIRTIGFLKLRGKSDNLPQYVSIGKDSITFRANSHSGSGGSHPHPYPL